MIEVLDRGTYLVNGEFILENTSSDQLTRLNYLLQQAGHAPLTSKDFHQEQSRQGTLAHKILASHNVGHDPALLKLKFDALASHDITYVGIIQTAIASGLEVFPVPYVMTNCHNSLCAVGGTINEDDHVFGLSAARKYGGIFVPPHQAVIHQYMREMAAGCGQMILGSDSHTRYGVLGTLGIGEGGPELVKQLLGRTYDLSYPKVIAVYLEGEPLPGVGPQDVALSLIGTVFKDAFVKNAILEFVGPGIRNLSVDFRNGIDVMTTETACLSSIWQTDEAVDAYFTMHGRPAAYQKLEPEAVAYYDGLIKVDLGRIVPMIALPFHPSNVYSIAELNENGTDIFRDLAAQGMNLADKIVNRKVKVEQGIVVGCSGGTFENIMAMVQILAGKPAEYDDFSLSVYPASQPIFAALLRNGAIDYLASAGATVRTAFCGPCFGAGDTPANGQLSIRHATRNFPNREGSNPQAGQLAAVALLDARSIAATALNGGLLTPATEVEMNQKTFSYQFDRSFYEQKVYQGFGKAMPDTKLKIGPNIAGWPQIRPLPENLLLRLTSVIHDPVTTTDELIPSGETSSYRSNPFKLAEFTLARKDPAYVGKAKEVQAFELQRQEWDKVGVMPQELADLFSLLVKNQFIAQEKSADFIGNTGIGSVIFARKPGDGSAREQAASCQRVLGGDANIALEYATKRYRSNLLNWGMLPFTITEESMGELTLDSWLFIPRIRQALQKGENQVTGYILDQDRRKIELKLGDLSLEERAVLLAGCLMNYYAQQ